MVKIPNPKNESEEFSFAFNSVYDQPTTQEELFNAEGSPDLPLFPLLGGCCCSVHYADLGLPQHQLRPTSRPCSRGSM